MVLKNKNKHEILDNSNVCLGEDDKISNLPDALIHHILSFCPILCAMSTCILSKKWNHIVSSIPILDFRNWRVDNTIDKKLETRRLMNCLDTVLCLHEKPDIQKFCLRWKDEFDEFQVYKWISILIKRKVRELFLSFVGPEKYLNFPLSFFTCDSLTVLELIFVRLNVPSTVSFPRLKLLRLKYINFVNGFSPNKLVSNCPNLEELSMEECAGLIYEVLCIANLALKKLYIRGCGFVESTVKISSPNLSTISYGHEVPADFVIDSFPSLVEADINMLYRVYDGTKKTVLIKLFEKLATVKLLKMSGPFVQVLSEADILLTSSLTFENLIRLEICSPCLVTMKRFFRFLQIKPNLESILFASVSR